MKVLIAEDDPNTLNGLAGVFRDEGYEVFTAPDGAREIDAPGVVFRIE